MVKVLHRFRMCQTEAICTDLECVRRKQSEVSKVVLKTEQDQADRHTFII
jgi:hypothetical protein